MNKKIWITGASTGIGKSLAIKFAEEGWQVAATARRENIASSKLIFVGAISKPTAHVKITNDITRGFIKLKKALI